MPAHQATIPKVLLLDIYMCCAAVRGTAAIITTFAPLIATGSILRIRAETTGFVALARCLEF